MEMFFLEVDCKGRVRIFRFQLQIMVLQLMTSKVLKINISQVKVDFSYI